MRRIPRSPLPQPLAAVADPRTPSTMASPPGPESLSSGDPEAARLRFRAFRYRDAAGPREALARLRALCRRWLRPEARSKEQMLELLVLEQFLGALPPEIRAWVQGQRPGSPEEAAALVEGLRRDPAPLLGWIAVQVLRQEVAPAAQETEAPLAPGPRPGSALEKAPADAGGPGPAPPLGCCVKEEPDAEQPQAAPSSPAVPTLSPGGRLGHQDPASSASHPPRTQVSTPAGGPCARQTPVTKGTGASLVTGVCAPAGPAPCLGLSGAPQVVEPGVWPLAGPRGPWPGRAGLETVWGEGAPSPGPEAASDHSAPLRRCRWGGA
ncbi:PREDICTED: zinc finger protein 446 isoform X2 [Condylura cristata]|uniref:zinc finger protein 446 isoform X2 n=1 Tax=Condylura cristata TaxID=143302 RepID=UPI000643E3FA|nr:PREDICTED: zinc finger protein 446 isoform X2 [Condylura cristata]